MRRATASCLALVFIAAPARGAQGLPDLGGLVDRHGAAVVNISTTQRLARSPLPRPGGDAPGEFSFAPGAAPQSDQETSLGSGFILSSEGHILTCAHVIKDAREIVVRLLDRREYPAELLGVDMRSDLALLKIEAERLRPAVLGDSARLRVGDWVFAIGSPFGFAHSATLGIVSAKGRSLPQESYVPFIQTDVAINPGNSGGPLFNLRGEVVGVNAQILSRSGGFMGVSFAIPIEIATHVVEQIRAQGHVQRAWLGVSLQEVTFDLAAAYGLKEARGALISDVLPGGPAEKGDLRPGDVILEFDGREVSSASDLGPWVGLTAPHRLASFRVARLGRGTETVKLRVGELRETPAVPASKPPPHGAPEPREEDAVGLQALALSEDDRRRLNVDRGVAIRPSRQGLAYAAGLRSGDVVLEVNGHRVHNPDEFHRLLAHAPVSRPALLRVRRNGVARYFALRLDPAGKP